MTAPERPPEGDTGLDTGRDTRRDAGRPVRRRTGTQTLDNALHLLELLRDQPDGLTIMDLAREVGLHRNSVSRMLGALGRHGLVARTESGRYQLGLGLIELAAAVAPRLRTAAAAELQCLADACDATAFVTALDEASDEALVVAVVEPRQSTIHVAYRAGTRHPVDRGASGIAILAGRPARPHERPEVGHARARGYSVTTGELQVGAWGLAAPLTNGTLPATASVGVVTIGEHDEARIAPAVLRAAAVITSLLERR